LGVFEGLNFYDNPKSLPGSVIKTVIRLDPNLVIISACSSAQTDNTSKADAKSNDTLSGSAEAFAKAWKPLGTPDLAYLGFAWEAGVALSIAYPEEFIQLLDGKRTIQEAFDAFRLAKASDPTLGDGYLLFKVWAPADASGKRPGLQQVIGK